MNLKFLKRLKHILSFKREWNIQPNNVKETKYMKKKKLMTTKKNPKKWKKIKLINTIQKVITKNLKAVGQIIKMGGAKNNSIRYIYIFMFYTRSTVAGSTPGYDRCITLYGDV